MMSLTAGVTVTLHTMDDSLPSGDYGSDNAGTTKGCLELPFLVSPEFLVGPLLGNAFSTRVSERANARLRT